MAEPTPNSTANQKNPNTPLPGDANVGDRHEAEVLTETAELVNEDGGRGMAQQGGEVRDEMAGPHPALANDELGEYPAPR